jgi:dTDP-4-dehydrorhamnose 3,5-epimerase
MRFTLTPIAGVVVLDPVPHEDERGRFMRAWCSQEFSDHDIHFVPVQANMGFNLRRGTVRGIHFQNSSAPEAKLVRCTRGSIFDVAVDLRPSSPTFKHWYGLELTADNGRMLFVPELCGHAYQTLQDCTEMHYMTSAYYTPSAVGGRRFDDPAFKINWPMEPTAVSEQDLSWPFLQS